MYESKLVLIGKGNVGKTSLSQKIVNPDAELLKRQATTEGIEIKSWQFYSNRIKDKFKFDIWDFAGQKKYDATHQLFITDNKSVEINP